MLASSGANICFYHHCFENNIISPSTWNSICFYWYLNLFPYTTMGHKEDATPEPTEASPAGTKNAWTWPPLCRRMFKKERRDQSYVCEQGWRSRRRTAGVHRLWSPPGRNKWTHIRDMWSMGVLNQNYVPITTYRRLTSMDCRKQNSVAITTCLIPIGSM
jgi:hypothetical protein